MYNLHCHSLLSDGALLPSEVARRYLALGYKVIAITDHVDYSNIAPVSKAILEFSRHWPKNSAIRVLPGIELTHLPDEQFKPLAQYARRRGIKIIVAHGETITEPVVKGTNRAALEADIDILAHPGFISDQDIKLAGAKKIFLEVTTRRGHCDSNAQLVKRSLELGAKLILNTDSHSPEDIIPIEEVKRIAQSAGLTLEQINKIYQEVEEFLHRKEG